MDEVVNHVCSQTELPLCKILSKSPTEFVSRSYTIGRIRICSPSTLILLITVFLCTLRMINSVKFHYSAVGRKEMRTFFYIYIASILLDMLLISKLFVSGNELIYTILLATQLALTNTCIFCLLIGSVTTLYMISYSFLSGSTITAIFSFAYFMTILPLIYFALSLRNHELFFIIVFALNGALILAYLYLQFHTMKILNTEVWAYGTVFLSFVFFIMAIVPLFYGCSLIALLTERYFDGLFCFHLFIFCAIMMIHKFWLSICENESECTPLIVKRKGHV